MKKALLVLLVLLLGVSCLNTAALASADDLVLITNRNGAIMYDSYDQNIAKPIALIPVGSVAVRLVDVQWGYCVVFGNYAGYISYSDCRQVSSNYYEYELPTGTDYSYGQTADDTAYVPEFPYTAQTCYGLQHISTRSGPSNSYTYHSRYPMETDMEVFYQVEKDGVRWCYLEFEANHSRYRLYTPMYRVEVDGYVPTDSEAYVWARITKQHTPRLGPGYEYATTEYFVGPAEVKAFYQENGWLLYEYTIQSGDIQRAWAPPASWK